MNDSYGVSWITGQLSRIPSQADISIILRHAEREDIPPGTFGVDVPLTACGVASAERLGAMLSAMQGRNLRRPPVLFPDASRRRGRYYEAATGLKRSSKTGASEGLAPLWSMRRSAGRCSCRSAYWR